MKALSNILRVLSILFGVAALVLFLFVPFGSVTTLTEGVITRTGAEFAFGSHYNSHDVGMSTDLLLIMITTAFTILFGALSFKYKKTRWATCGFSLFTTIYMIVVTCSASNKFLDTQGFKDAASTAYVNNTPLFVTVAIGLSFIAATAYLLVSDKLACIESGKPTIIKRFVKFLRDYKGEISKIVWPNFRSVVKNTVIVLIMCAILGVIIWAVDFGLGNLVQLILGK